MSEAKSTDCYHKKEEGIMKVAYIAGPFRAETPWLVEQNIRRAESVALAAHLKGYAVICPHTSFRFFTGAAPDETWLAAGLELLRRSDVLILVPGWEGSVGTRSEMRFALDYDKKILPAEVNENGSVTIGEPMYGVPIELYENGWTYDF
jgi:hypothetical protein